MTRRAPSASTARCCSRRSRRPRSTRRRGGSGSASPTPRPRAVIMNDPNFKGVGGSFDPHALPGRDPPVRLHRAALRRRAAQGVAAPADRRHDRRRPRAAEDADRRAEPLPERAALDRIRQARRSPGRHHRPALARGARRLFRRSQGPVPRARISQDRLRRDHAGRDRQMDRRLRRGRQESCSSSARTSSARRRSARSRRSYSPTSDEAQAAREPHRRRDVVRRSRQGARAQRRPTSISASSPNPPSSTPRSRDAAFALPAGEVSQPVQGKFGTALVKVGKIEPGDRAELRERCRRHQAARSPPSARASRSPTCATRWKTSAAAAPA